MADLSNHWLILVLDVSLKTFCLWVIAWCALKGFRFRDSNLRHRVWSGVLLGMLSLPLLAACLPTVPLPFQIDPEWLTVDEPAQKSETPETASIEPETDPFIELAETRAGIQAPIDAADRRESEVAFSGTNPRDARIQNGQFFADSRFDRQIADSAEIGGSEDWDSEDSIPTNAALAVPSATPPRSGWTTFIRVIPNAVLLVWLTVSGLFLFRLCFGLYSTRRMLNRSERIERGTISSRCPQLPRALWKQTVSLRTCREVRVPVTVGWMSPSVLLPEEWTKWSGGKLEAVLVHELTHVARRDFAVALLADLNRCLYWFHPVSWWLQKHLSDLAEEACDDAAIGYTGDPTGYAGLLLEVAANLSGGEGRLVSPGMPMARESNVETRITAILDFTRPLSRRLTWKTAALIALVCVPVIGLAAALRPGTTTEELATTSDAAEPAEENASQDASAESGTKESGEADTQLSYQGPDFRIHGQVVDDNRDGIPQARVRLYRVHDREWYASPKQATLIHEFKLDAHGRFDRRIDLDEFPEIPQGTLYDRPGRDVLVVSAPGYVYATRTFENHSETPEEQIVRLWKEVPVRGRILDLEGQPVANASIGISELIRSDPEKIDDWLSQVSFEPLKEDFSVERMMALPGGGRKNRFPEKRNLQLPVEAAPKVTTNERGEFQLHGVGPDDLVLINLEGPAIATGTLHVLARDTRRFYAAHHSNLSVFGPYYGQDFDFITQPSVPVYGVVRDIESKEPLAGVAVAVGSVYGTQMSHTGYIATTTDENGRYRIEGLPIPPPNTRANDGNRLAVRPQPLPYIENDWNPVPIGDGFNPVEFDLELRRAVLAKGRLTDQLTGEPVQAKFYYAPFRTNEHVEKYHRYADQVTTMLGNDSRYYTDEEGYFEIPVIPGRGVIAAKCLEGSYRTSFGAAGISEFADEKQRNLGQLALSDHIVPSLYHSLKEVDPGEDDTEIEIEMHVDSGQSLPVKFFDPRGNPLSGVSVNGLSGWGQWDNVNADRAEIEGLALGEIRPLRAYHRERKLSRMVRLIPNKGQTEFRLTLLPETIVYGRLIDPDGQPLAGVSLEARHDLDPDFMGTEAAGEETDADGKFELSLPVGTTYRLIGYKDDYITIAKDLEVTKPQTIDLGDLVVDPDKEPWSEVTAKRKPLVTDRKPQESKKAQQESLPESNEDSPPAKSSDGSSKKANQPADESEPLVFSGNVIDPEGKPVEGAAIHLIYGWRPEPKIETRPLAVTGKQGEFRFTLVPTPLRTGQGQLVAVKDGYAFAHQHAQAFEKTGRVTWGATEGEREWLKGELKDATDTLQLLPDNEPIRGRIVDTEGQPVAGALVRVKEVSESKSGDLSAWVAAATADGADHQSIMDELSHMIGGTVRAHLVVPVVKTGEDGWFSLRGLGRHRIAKVVISHPEIASATFHVRPQVGETIEVTYDSDRPDDRTDIYYPNRFTYVAAPCQTVVGRVTERESGKPVPNCFIRYRNGDLIHTITVRTNADGEYRLPGLPLGERDLQLIPLLESRLIPLAATVNGKTPGAEITKNVELPAGVMLEGRAIDPRTGQPIFGHVEYATFPTNPHLALPIGVRLAYLDYHYVTTEDGHFRMPVLPGEGLILFNADEHGKFLRGVGRETVSKSHYYRKSDTVIQSTPFFANVDNYHFLSQIEPPPDTDKFEFDIEISSGIDLSGRVVRPDGSEVDEFWIYGLWQTYTWHPPGKRNHLIEGYFAHQPRRIIAWVPEENLAGTILLEGEQTEPLTIKLQPAGHVTGRFVDEDGLPLAGLKIENREQVNYDLNSTAATPHESGAFPADWDELKETLYSDEEGRFRASGLVPGLRYSAGISRYGKYEGYSRWKTVGTAFENLVFKPGETKDLGDIVIKVPAE